MTRTATASALSLAAAGVVLGSVCLVALAGCGGTSLTTRPPEADDAVSSGAGALPLVAKAPTVHRSPDVFVAGETTTERLASGRRLTLTVTGPSLANPVAGKPVQFAPTLLLTFTVRASVDAGDPVTLSASDFHLGRAVDGGQILNGPASVVVTPSRSELFRLTTVQDPGQGELQYFDGSTKVASWSYVAEND